MLDVHPPHHRLEGLKDFLIHLLTISVGLLIAVGIEGCVERHQHRELAQEARETLRKEIEKNSKTISDVLPEIDKKQTKVTNGITFLEHVRQNPKDKSAQHGSITADYSSTDLDDTAWKTAQTTGALAFMPYEEANRYSGIYAAQYQFQVSQEKIMEDVAQFVGIAQKYDLDTDITPEASSAIMERLGIMEMHLAMLKLLAEEAAATDKNFLTGKDTPTSFHEELKH
jgi:hypothetical protein